MLKSLVTHLSKNLKEKDAKKSCESVYYMVSFMRSEFFSHILRILKMEFFSHLL